MSPFCKQIKRKRSPIQSPCESALKRIKKFRLVFTFDESIEPGWKEDNGELVYFDNFLNKGTSLPLPCENENSLGSSDNNSDSELDDLFTPAFVVRKDELGNQVRTPISEKSNLTEKQGDGRKRKKKLQKSSRSDPSSIGHESKCTSSQKDDSRLKKKASKTKLKGASEARNESRINPDVMKSKWPIVPECLVKLTKLDNALLKKYSAKNFHVENIVEKVQEPLPSPVSEPAFSEKPACAKPEQDKKNTPLKKMKQFECAVCGKTFRKEANLLKHAKRHLKKRRKKSKPQKCDQCEMTFSLKSLLVDHMQAHHGNNNKEKQGKKKRIKAKVDNLESPSTFRTFISLEMAESLMQDNDTQEPDISECFEEEEQVAKSHVEATAADEAVKCNAEKEGANCDSQEADICSDEESAKCAIEIEPTSNSFSENSDDLVDTELELGYLFEGTMLIETEEEKSSYISSDSEPSTDDWVYPFIVPEEFFPDMIDFQHFILSGRSDDDYEAIQEEEDNGAIGNEDDYLLVTCSLATTLKEPHKKCVKYDCVLCGRRFKDAASFKVHKRVHRRSSYLWVKCNECKKEFRALTLLVSHMNIHTGEKPFKCTQTRCNKHYANVGNLRYHLKVFHSRKRSLKSKSQRIKNKTKLPKQKLVEIPVLPQNAPMPSMVQEHQDQVDKKADSPPEPRVTKPPPTKPFSFNFYEQARNFVDKSLAEMTQN